MSTSGTLISRNGIFWLAAMLILTQLPHALHLPLWVSASGIVLILGKAIYTRGFSRYFPPYILVGLAFVAALSVRLEYDYFMGRDPGVAFLFLLVSLKFAETRKRRDVTLLICLSGFLLFTQYFYSQSLVAAMVSIPAVFAMGGALFVLRDYSQNPDIRSALVLISKLLIQGIPLAAALFFLFPRLSSPLWNLPADARATSGLSDSMAPGSISELSLSDEIAFRVEFDGPAPAQQDLYWRGPVFDSFNGRVWQASPGEEIAKPVSRRDQNPTDYIVTLEPHHNRWLFALDMPASLPTNASHAKHVAKPLARLTNQQQLLADSTVSNTLRYKQSSYLSDHYISKESEAQKNTLLARGNTRTTEFARRVRQETSSDRELVETLLDWLHQEPFFYTLKPTLLGDNPIDEFLFSTREGFCEHYASAFVYLLRSADIPARVVTGYQGGEMNGDYLIVRQSDAHAWTEAWIDGRWQRFDPTAAVAPERVLSGMASALGDDEPVPLYARLDGNWFKKVQLSWDALNHRWRRHVINFGLDNQLALLRNFGLATPDPWKIALLAIFVAAIWATLILNMRLRGATRLSEAEKAYAVFLNKMRDAGLAHKSTQGPLEFADLAAKQFPKLADRIETITQLYIQLQYARPTTNQAEQKKNLLNLRRQIQFLFTAASTKLVS